MGDLRKILPVCIALMLVLSWAPTASSKVDIDYSHTVTGTGTLMTDYQLEDSQRSEASGIMRGTGNVMNSYSFSTNNSSLLMVEDRFVLSQSPSRAMTMSVPQDYPVWPKSPIGYRLIGESWAEGIKIAAYSSPQEKPDALLSMEERSINGAGEHRGEFKFAGASQEGTAATAATRVADPTDLMAEATLAISSLNNSKGFDYRARWFNSSNVTIRSFIGEPKAVLYEDDGWISGYSTGQKKLKIFS